jgi:hypothetical protein
VAARNKLVEQAADELYALPPSDFTGARDERAKALRKEGQREEAGAVKALRKPTLAAFALNQLARRRRKDVEALLAAGEKLRAAQEELLAGGDRNAFQSAASSERDQVAALATAAAGLAAEAGERASPGLEEKVAATLHAAVLDEETGEQLRAGRLLREREAIGGFGAMTAARPRAPAAAQKRGKSRAKASGDAKPRDTAADAKRRKAANKQDAERRQRLAAARTDERHARRELDAAEKAIAHAETRAEAARTHAEEANRRAQTTAERLKDARRQQAAAKKAHARAERALAAAERES